MLRHGLTGLALSAALVLGAVATAGPDTSDAWLTTKAKIALLTTNGVSATAVNVDTVGGKVTIHGKVQTAEEKAKAEAVVRKVDGVKDVTNLLQVVPEAVKETVQASDDTIRSSVDSVLHTDASLKDVKVASVNKGVVLLAGNTRDLDAKLKAIELTIGTPGVKRVATEIKTAEN